MQRSHEITDPISVAARHKGCVRVDHRNTKCARVPNPRRLCAPTSAVIGVVHQGFLIRPWSSSSSVSYSSCCYTHAACRSRACIKTGAPLPSPRRPPRCQRLTTTTPHRAPGGAAGTPSPPCKRRASTHRPRRRSSPYPQRGQGYTPPPPRYSRDAEKGGAVEMSNAEQQCPPRQHHSPGRRALPPGVYTPPTGYDLTPRSQS
ncbi:hypothetical protein B0H13DRAFT_632988 [Mycena leptocephala]|nr:hypothetical protein B0H13DRAFT_632988 [Mycena leptocephala]